MTDWGSNRPCQFHQEVNPSLKDAQDVQATVAVGCSLVRAALGKQPSGAVLSLCRILTFVYRRNPSLIVMSIKQESAPK